MSSSLLRVEKEEQSPSSESWDVDEGLISKLKEQYKKERKGKKGVKSKWDRNLSLAAASLSLSLSLLFLLVLDRYLAWVNLTQTWPGHLSRTHSQTLSRFIHYKW